MAKNQLYGYSFRSSGGGGAAANLSSAGRYSSRSLPESFKSSEPSMLGSARYLASSDLLSSSSSSPKLLFSHTDGYSVAVDRIPAVTVASPATSHMASYVSWPGPPGVDVGVGLTSAAGDILHSGLKRPASEALYHQNIMGACNMIGPTEAWFSTNPLAKRPRFESASHLPIYPQRPGEKDCAYYMLTRTCKFGDSCKFDHPIWVPEGGIPDWKEVPMIANGEFLPERPGVPDCPYFVKTQRCKFGSRCKFNHPKDETSPLGSMESVHVVMLPDRPSEPPCAFYMKTGKCKYGATCKFHHPKDLQIPVTAQENNSAEEAGVADNETANSFFSPAVMHNSKGLPVRLGEVDCPFYLKTGSCKYGATCRYNHPDRNTINPPAASPAQHLKFGVVSPAASILQSFDSRLTQAPLHFGLGTTIYPQRPGEIECDFYMKTGDCKFGQRCRFHHPFDRSVLAQEAQMQSVKLTLAGLPRREGAVHCPYYMKTGTCKYGATCKFDHPPPGEVMASSAVGEDEKVAEPI
ncbi:hypothetical protein M9H77_15180 [Catharanthus roseus]|uniref:Uncharacterized protein n=1 Tax=Catharanthus roseus TaxID=4058 RepID=A0ACC0BQF8_CATRO|nr:hypothetical protein M9H77_15180 [Catharanthus roseus]